MRHILLIVLFGLPLAKAEAQSIDEWEQLCGYAQSIGIDSLCNRPDSSCLARYFLQIVYGKPERRMSYQGLPETVDSVGLHTLIRRFRNGDDWTSLLDSMESGHPHYAQLKKYYLDSMLTNSKADAQITRQTQWTLNFYRWLNRFPASKRILINIPAATLQLIDEQGNTLLQSRVIVGKKSTPTPSFTAWITELVVYPFWNVPRSITVRELLPKIRRNPQDRLEAMNLQVINAKGAVVDPRTVNWNVSPEAFPYRLRQLTGCDNALGLLKFNLKSPYDIYLHDTNARTLFARENRFLSHGCVRVEKPVELANLLLGYPHFRSSFLTNCPVNARSRTIRLPEPVPVIITYNILDVDEKGAIQVYLDVYDWWRKGI